MSTSFYSDSGSETEKPTEACTNLLSKLDDIAKEISKTKPPKKKKTPAKKRTERATMSLRTRAKDKRDANFRESSLNRTIVSRQSQPEMAELSGARRKANANFSRQQPPPRLDPSVNEFTPQNDSRDPGSRSA